MDGDSDRRQPGRYHAVKNPVRNPQSERGGQGLRLPVECRQWSDQLADGGPGGIGVRFMHQVAGQVAVGHRVEATGEPQQEEEDAFSKGVAKDRINHLARLD